MLIATPYEVIENLPNFPNRKFIPILDNGATVLQLAQRINDIRSKYKIISIFLAGDNIVGSCADIGDYTCLVAEIKDKEDVKNEI